MEKNKLISVIIPTYNREKSLQQSVESVLNQTYQNLECIVVDDNSSDNTRALIASLKDSRIRYVRNNVNRGAAGARNVGIHAAFGELIAFNDSDDVWMVDKLEKQYTYLMSHREFSLVYSAFELFDEESKAKFRYPSALEKQEDLEGDIFFTLLKANKVDTPTILVFKECLNSVGGFNEQYRALEDYELCLRIAKRYKIGYINEVLVYAYPNSSGVNSNIENGIDACIRLIDRYRHDSSNNHGMYAGLFHNVYREKNDNVRSKYCQNIAESLRLDYAAVEYMAEISKEKMLLHYRTSILFGLLEVEDIIGFWTTVISKYKARSIAVYGGGRIGKIIIRQLLDSGLPLKYVIDRNEIVCNNVIKINMNDIPADIDLIISSISELLYDRNELSQYTGAPIVNIIDMLQP